MSSALFTRHFAKKILIQSVVMGVAIFGGACTVKIRVPAARVATNTAPNLDTFAVTNSAYTNSTSYGLSFSVSGSYTDYCILENDTTVTNCTWTVGIIPSTFTVSGANGLKILTLWVRNSYGISSPMNSNSVTLDTVNPSITLSSLTGGQVIAGGTNTSINWSGSDAYLGTTSVAIEVSSDSGSTWSVLTSGGPNSGTYSWSVPSINSTTYRIRLTMTDLATNQSSSSSTSDFSISTTTPASLSITSHTSPYNYGNVGVGNSATVTFTLTNSGGATANTIALTGLSLPLSRNAGVASNCGVTLAAAATCSIQIDYSPTTNAALSQILNISYNDGVGGSGSLNFSLTGQGISRANLVFTIPANPYDFGSVSYPESSNQTVIVTNTGNITATGISFSTLLAPFQRSSNTCGATLAAGVACGFSLDFIPELTAGGYSDTLTLDYTDASSTVGQSSINMTGTGTRSFVSDWDTTIGFETITLPLRSGYNYNFTVNWGDGSTSTVTSWNDPDITHTFQNPGTQRIRITGLAEAWYFNNLGDKDKITAVIDLGDLGWINLDSAFEGCRNLVSFAGGVTTQVTNMSDMFNGTIRLSSMDLSRFNTALVTDMSGMFEGAQELSTSGSGFVLTSFDTSQVTTMANMFRRIWPDGAFGVNSVDLTSFNTSQVTDMSGMFAENPTLPLTSLSLNTSNVQNMSLMFASSFSNSACGGPCSSFDANGLVGPSVTDVSGMFAGTTKLSSLQAFGWNISSVSSSTSIFSGAYFFLTVSCDQGGSPGTGSLFGMTCQP